MNKVFDILTRGLSADFPGDCRYYVIPGSINVTNITHRKILNNISG